MQGFNKLFKAEEFTPYDPTQDVIFPPELMVSLFYFVLQAITLWKKCNSVIFPRHETRWTRYFCEKDKL